jgi:hypothetical protein
MDAKAKIKLFMIVLDAFTGTTLPIAFYYNQGFIPKGFHF